MILPPLYGQAFLRDVIAGLSGSDSMTSRTRQFSALQILSIIEVRTVSLFDNFASVAVDSPTARRICVLVM